MARARSDDAPAFWIIAGPNGSGKSTLYGSRRDAIYGNTIISDPDRPFWIINPDLLASRISHAEGLAPNKANLEAVIRIEAWLKASIKAHQSIGVETVLSTDKYRRLVDLRVRKGGHDVPTIKIEERWKRSLNQLPWFLTEADWALLFDNSDTLGIVGRKRDGIVTVDETAPSALAEAVNKINQ